MTSPAYGVPVPGYAVPGTEIARRYVLSRRIAGGGMGDVWRAHDQVLDRAVALKLLRSEYLDEPAFLARFRAEARLAGLLDHPGIAAVHDYGEVDGPGGAAWLVMELVEGQPLSRILAQHGALTPEQALDVIGQTACALQAAHDAGVIHRDVKPGNLLVQPDGVVKITDFGIARAAGAAPLTRTGTVLGTAHYLSPEQVQGKSASTASDIYALGVVAYECFAGRRPFDGDSPVEVALAHQRDPVPPLPPQLPGPVVALVLRALAKSPLDRPASAGSFGRTALAIRAALYLSTDDTDQEPAASKPQHAGGSSTPDTPTPVGGTRRGLRVPQLVLAALLLVLTVAAVRHATRSPVRAPAAAARAASAAAAPAGAPAPAPAPAGLVVDPASYRGKPAAQVLAALTALGLTPSAVQVAADGPPGTVVTIVGASGSPLPARLQRGEAVHVEVVAVPAGAGRSTLDNGRN